MHSAYKLTVNPVTTFATW